MCVTSEFTELVDVVCDTVDALVTEAAMMAVAYSTIVVVAKRGPGEDFEEVDSDEVCIPTELPVGSAAVVSFHTGMPYVKLSCDGPKLS